MNRKQGSTVIPRIVTWCMSARERSPIIQKMMLCRRLSWVIDIKNIMTAPQKALTITPESSRRLF